MGFGPEVGGELGGHRGAGIGLQFGHQDPGALPCERPGDTTTDPVAGAGDDRRSIL